MKFKILMSFISCLIISPIYAALDLELTQGMQGAIPIAIAPFAGQESSSPVENIASVVTNDLSHSGRFKMINSVSQDPHDASEVNYSLWQKSGANNLVVGKVIPQADGKYQVTFQLINVFSGQTRQEDKNFVQPTLLNEQFTVNKNNLRGLAHHISDLVYQQLTGDRGIFSTKIAYVLVQRIANQNKYFLEVADQDGYGSKTLMTSNQPIMSPTWSPNAKSIAYVSFEGDQDGIYIQNIFTGGRKLISQFPGMNTAPAWSPDGSKIALVLTKTGYPKVYIMDVASGQLTQLTEGYSMDTEPAWSPNGKTLIFTSDRGGGPEIYEMDLASRQIQRLTFNSQYNARGTLTPDGQSLVMLTQSGSGYDIAIQDLQTGRVTLLTNSGNTQSPSVAPNGKMVAYADQDQGVGILGMVSTDGRVKLRIPAGNGSVQEPAWSPYLSN